MSHTLLPGSTREMASVRTIDAIVLYLPRQWKQLDGICLASAAKCPFNVSGFIFFADEFLLTSISQPSTVDCCVGPIEIMKIGR